MVKNVTFKDAWDGQADCRVCALRESVLFAGLNEGDFEHIHQPIDQYTLPVGAVLYRSGDSGQRMYTIRSGVLKLVQYLPDGSQRIVRLIRSTDVTGLECLLGKPYQHDAIVLQETEVCSLPIKVVDNLSQENPTLHRELLNRWQRALNEADAWLTELSTGSAKQRVARLLFARGQRHGEQRVRTVRSRGYGSDARHYHRNRQPHHCRVQAPESTGGKPQQSLPAGCSQSAAHCRRLSIFNAQLCAPS
uniref:Transcriptional regulator Crp/Fnr n=1 Tax=Candidatus Endoriftia persephone str. Hot96_1+Hot96_2 TaxID=394104 RepID=Q0PQH8_9GAMM|nr:transcriptional regulator Crp/Fnr [Candidatus Endoriftia persephone str. Hot96_1+Hot96_2]